MVSGTLFLQIVSPSHCLGCLKMVRDITCEPHFVYRLLSHDESDAEFEKAFQRPPAHFSYLLFIKLNGTRKTGTRGLQHSFHEHHGV
jgi:hypothetical protein